MEEVYLYSLLRLRHKMTPIRETFPQSVHAWPEKPGDTQFRCSYNYLVKPPSYSRLPKSKAKRKPVKSFAAKSEETLTPAKSVSCLADSKKTANSKMTPEQTNTQPRSAFMKEVAGLRDKLNKLEGLVKH